MQGRLGSSALDCKKTKKKKTTQNFKNGRRHENSDNKKYVDNHNHLQAFKNTMQIKFQKLF